MMALVYSACTDWHLIGRMLKRATLMWIKADEK
jgi:hypothetical protein